jgi:MoxR-like ATPase
MVQWCCCLQHSSPNSCCGTIGPLEPLPQLRWGGVAVPLRVPETPELVPFCVAPQWCAETQLQSEELRKTLLWMLQKELLRQDMFLLAPSGPLGRWLVDRFCELLGKPAHHISITPDTVESDLKQHREIVGHSLRFVDSPCVEAALKGRVLIIEGLELAERGVATVLNNLLENREMHLEDGRFLTNATRFDSLDESSVRKHLLIRTHPDFRVIVVGVPNSGSPLDPPIRSRFQYGSALSFGSPMQKLRHLEKLYPRADKNLLRGLVSFAATTSAKYLEQQEASQPNQKQSRPVASPELSVEAVDYVARVLHETSPAWFYDAFRRAYPYHEMVLDDPVVAAVRTGLKWLNLLPEKEDTAPKAPAAVVLPPRLVSVDGFVASFADQSQLPIPRKNAHSSCRRLLSDADAPLGLGSMVLDHCLGRHMLLVGPRGCGKTWLAHLFSQTVGLSPPVTLQLYEDLGSRELLQKRATLDNGDTIWVNSPVVDVALNGGCVILDGVDQMKPGMLASLKRLVEDGEVDLPDGSHLVSRKRWGILTSKSSAARLTELNIRPVHETFRIIGIGISATKKKKWLTSDLVSLFKVHSVGLESNDKLFSCLQSVGGSKRVIDGLLRINAALAQLGESTLPPLSMRQLLRLCRRKCPPDNLPQLRLPIATAFLAQFLPLASKTVLDKVLADCGFGEPIAARSSSPLVLEEDAKGVRIGDVWAPVMSRASAANSALIPSIKFFPVQAHLILLREMLFDWQNGEHLLLIGTQGVGKNVLADKMLQMLRVEREYVQLHRDTTVQSLTLQPSLSGGVIVWEDSPLVRAVKYGRCLVVDEIDKAPVEVVLILKSLLEDGGNDAQRRKAVLEGVSSSGNWRR